jgi:hypothetical protein
MRLFLRRPMIDKRLVASMTASKAETKSRDKM